MGRNKEVIQPYSITIAQYKFNLIEKRIMYRIVEALQLISKGYIQDLNKKASYKKTENGGLDLELPISCFLTKEDKNYSRIKEALLQLNNKTIKVETEQIWQAINFIEHPKINKYKKTVTVEFHLYKDIYKALTTFSRGYRKYELETAFNFKSIYTMRFYEMFSKQTKSIILSIDTLKEMFQLSKKYKILGHFIKNVIEPAKKELDIKSPYSFVYERVLDSHQTGKGRKKIIALNFTPTYHPYNTDKNLEEKLYSQSIRKQIPIHAYVSSDLQTILKEKIGFTDMEIKNNYKLFHKAKLLTFIIDDQIIKKATTAKNPKGYIINTMKRKINKIQNQKTQQKSILESLNQSKPRKKSTIRDKIKMDTALNNAAIQSSLIKKEENLLINIITRTWNKLFKISNH